VEPSTAADTKESPPKKRKLEEEAELIKSCQETKGKKKREEEQEEVEEETEELASDSSYNLELHDSTRSSLSSEEEDNQEDDYKNKKLVMSSKKRTNSKRHEIDEIDLTNMGNMVNSFRLTSISQPPSAWKKKKNILHQGYLPSSGSPFLIYDWKNSAKSNNMLNIKVLLFQEPRILDDFAVEIEEKGGQ
jgi:hypothetical protein